MTDYLKAALPGSVFELSSDHGVDVSRERGFSQTMTLPSEHNWPNVVKWECQIPFPSLLQLSSQFCFCHVFSYTLVQCGYISVFPWPLLLKQMWSKTTLQNFCFSQNENRCVVCVCKKTPRNWELNDSSLSYQPSQSVLRALELHSCLWERFTCTAKAELELIQKMKPQVITSPLQTNPVPHNLWLFLYLYLYFILFAEILYR